MSEMRKCKECGKMFIPKGREQYCSDTHYRPCPICGEPVIVKYLSDPPRKCDNCKGKKTTSVNAPSVNPMKSKSLFNIRPDDFKMSVPVPETSKVSEIKEEKDDAVISNWEKLLDPHVPAQTDQNIFCETVNGTVRVFTGKKLPKGFLPGHEYLLKVEHDEYTYVVTGVEDLTIGDTVDIVRNFSSQMSFHQNFAKFRKGVHQVD